MTDTSRRKYLAATAATLTGVTSLAGCVMINPDSNDNTDDDDENPDDETGTDEQPSETNDNDNPDENDDTDGEDTDPDDTGVELETDVDDNITIETFTGPSTQVNTDWDGTDPETAGGIQIFTEELQTRQVMSERMSQDAIDEFREIVAETDFETSLLIHIESAGPTVCHALATDLVTQFGTQLSAHALVYDGRGDGQACAEAVTHPSEFVRITFDVPLSQAPVDTLAYTIVNGWDTQETFTYTW